MLQNFPIEIVSNIVSLLIIVLIIIKFVSYKKKVSVIDGLYKLEEENNTHLDKISDVNKTIIDTQNVISKYEVNKAKIQSEIDGMQNRMWDEYGLTHNEALEKHNEIENISEARKEIFKKR